MISWAICAPGHLEIHRKHKQQQQRAKVRRLSDDFRGRGCYTEIFFKKASTFGTCLRAERPVCLYCLPSPICSLTWHSSDSQSCRLEMGGGGVLHRDLPPQRLSITWCAKAETVSAGKAVRGEPSFLGAAILVWCMATCTGLGCRSHGLQN